MTERIGKVWVQKIDANGHPIGEPTEISAVVEFSVTYEEEYNTWPSGPDVCVQQDNIMHITLKQDAARATDPAPLPPRTQVKWAATSVGFQQTVALGNIRDKTDPHVDWYECAFCGVPLRRHEPWGSWVDARMQTACDGALVEFEVEHHQPISRTDAEHED